MRGGQRASRRGHDVHFQGGASRRPVLRQDQGDLGAPQRRRAVHRGVDGGEAVPSCGQGGRGGHLQGLFPQLENQGEKYEGGAGGDDLGGDKRRFSGLQAPAASGRAP
ncbi:unnamed protein product [Ectocarpus sp. 4 AP-2014]